MNTVDKSLFADQRLCIILTHSANSTEDRDKIADAADSRYGLTGLRPGRSLVAALIFVIVASVGLNRGQTLRETEMGGEDRRGGDRSGHENHTRLCERCLREVPEGRGLFFEVRLEIVSDPTPQLLDDEYDSASIRDQWKDIVSQLEQLGPTEAMEQVYRRRVWSLCNPCLEIWLDAPFGSS